MHPWMEQTILSFSRSMYKYVPSLVKLVIRWKKPVSVLVLHFLETDQISGRVADDDLFYYQ